MWIHSAWCEEECLHQGFEVFLKTLWSRFPALQCMLDQRLSFPQIRSCRCHKHITKIDCSRTQVSPLTEDILWKHAALSQTTPWSSTPAIGCVTDHVVNCEQCARAEKPSGNCVGSLPQVVLHDMRRRTIVHKTDTCRKKWFGGINLGISYRRGAEKNCLGN